MVDWCVVQEVFWVEEFVDPWRALCVVGSIPSVECAEQQVF